MPAIAISLGKDMHTNKTRKKSNFNKFIRDIAESNFTMTSHSKLILPYYWFTQLYTFSRTLDVMFKVKQPFIKNCLLLLHITLFLVQFNNICGNLLSKFKGLKKLSKLSSNVNQTAHITSGADLC